MLQNQCFHLLAMSATGRYLRTKGLRACLGLLDKEYGYQRVKLSLQVDKNVLQLTVVITQLCKTSPATCLL